MISLPSAAVLKLQPGLNHDYVTGMKVTIVIVVPIPIVIVIIPIITIIIIIINNHYCCHRSLTALWSELSVRWPSLLTGAVVIVIFIFIIIITI